MPPSTEFEAMLQLIQSQVHRHSPLYVCQNGILKRASVPRGANFGLWYDKFPNMWNAEFNEFQQKHTIIWEPPGRPPRTKDAQVVLGKLEWIQSVSPNPYQGGVPHCGFEKLIDEMNRRQEDLVTALGGRTFPLVNESRFVSGLGREHPVENGFAWHHTLGTPYLPGSSLKGMIRAWANAEGKSEEADALLGCSSGGVGRLIILDMLPSRPVNLVADVMTPHYSPYYDSKTKQIPGDWHSPVPIPFLACEAGNAWQLSVLPGSRSCSAKIEDDLTLVQTWLLESLAWQGAGAKTAVGYGRFVEPA